MLLNSNLRNKTPLINVSTCFLLSFESSWCILRNPSAECFALVDCLIVCHHKTTEIHEALHHLHETGSKSVFKLELSQQKPNGNSLETRKKLLLVTFPTLSSSSTKMHKMCF